MTDHSAPTRGEVTQGDHLLKATWFRFCPSTGEYTGEYCSVRPADDSNMVPMLNPSAVMEVAVAARLAAIEEAAKVAEGDVDWSNFGKRDVEQWDAGPDAARDYRLGIASGRATAAAIRNLGRGV